MMPWPFGIRITVQRSTADRFNDRTYTDHHQVDGCIDYPTGSDEQGLTNSHVTNLRELLAPPDADVVVTDRVLIHPDGVALVPADDPIRRTSVYQVVGDPKNWKNPYTGWNPGMQISLERVT